MQGIMVWLTGKKLSQSSLYLAASPTQTVETSGRICLIVSNIAIPEKSKGMNVRQLMKKITISNTIKHNKKILICYSLKKNITGCNRSSRRVNIHNNILFRRSE